ncbi:tetratricopeptide repeat protein [Acidipila sp. EB88]|uniref:tetratricopeptide repeat protein n=1 Tax=Acidipila sp. EB88 TaxID=2305226 RepID=UPI000F5F5BDA|nr:tetratricopeptide repeat protein [Acidipila sp. EB88]RRA47893.1 tetratricopeptide repeat protein [Acidipila sp. EB88]
MNSYCRKDVLRIFRIREQQLRIWERNGLIACADNYTFQDLGQLRKLRELGEHRISAGSIRNAVSAMRAVSGLADPLLQASLAVVPCGPRRLTFRHSGTVVDPIAGQYLLDFSGSGASALAPIAVATLSVREREQETVRLFAKAVYAEEAGHIDEALERYEDVLDLTPGHAPSAINMGTIFYNRRDFARAEQFYRMATESDGTYALAFFDLGNVLDELKRMPQAIVAYRRAITLQPHYADAHYNLALALERNGQRRSALRHWTSYLRLDGTGPWATHARTQLRKTLSVLGMELVQGQASRPRHASKARPAKEPTLLLVV